MTLPAAPVVIYLNSMACAADALGVFRVVTQANREPAFVGGYVEAAGYLRNQVPVGVSVEVRCAAGLPASGADGVVSWVRSCMNKPSLWEAIEREEWKQAMGLMALRLAAARAEVARIEGGR